MTHTLHRLGTKNSLGVDYIILAISSRQCDGVGVVERFVEFMEIVNGHNPINFGDMRSGSIAEFKCHELADKFEASSIVHAVFSSLDDLEGAVSDLKDADLGLSIVISSLRDDAARLARKVGVILHTQAISLGIHGDLRLLPPESLLHVTTQCGHGLIAASLVKHMVQRVQVGQLTTQQAAREIARQCTCGVSNVLRIEALVRGMVGKGL